MDKNRICARFALAGLVIAAAGTAASAQYAAGDQWFRAADFVTGTHGSMDHNPGPGFDGTPVWQYELVNGGGGLGSANPWYKSSTTLMTWDSDWYGIGQGAWSGGDDVNPPVFQDRMTHNIIGPQHDAVPMVRWMNPGGELNVAIDGNYNVLWSGHQLVGDAVDVELVVARQSGSSVDVLFSTMVSKPSAGLSIGDNVDVPVNLPFIQLDAGDSLIFSGRATDSKTGLGRWVVISDQLRVEVVPVPAPGALALMGIAGLGAARRRRK